MPGIALGSVLGSSLVNQTEKIPSLVELVIEIHYSYDSDSNSDECQGLSPYHQAISHTSRVSYNSTQF